MSKKSMKQELLKNLRSEMKSSRRGDIGSLLGEMKPKKIIVSADSEKGLKEGLSKAQEIMEHKTKDDSKACSKCDKSPCDC